MTRRILLLLLTCSFLVGCSSPPNLASTDNGEALEKITLESTIPELQALMDEDKISSVELTQFYLDRIQQENPRLNAIISVNPEALSLAAKLDEERNAGKVRGPLHGIPIVVKDNIETMDMATTAGSLALKDNNTRRDAPLVQNLRNAGAIILAKANLSEWANFRSSRSSSGWSGVGGQTKNPHDITRSPCGSSSGSGAAVAANLAVAAVGTETDGSITCPSSATGIVGIKPTVGLVSRTYVVPISHSQDTAGPMAKSVTDAAILLASMQGPDALDPATTQRSFDFPENYRESLEPTDLKPMRFGLLQSPAMDHEAVNALFDTFVKNLTALSTTVDVSASPEADLGDDEFEMLMYEFKHDLNTYLSSLPNDLSQLTLNSLIEFNRAHANEEMPWFQQEIFVSSEEKGPLTEQRYQDLSSSLLKATRDDGLDSMIDDNELDAILSVTLGPAWKIDKVNGDHYVGGISSYAAIAGYPHITIPLGEVHGLPIGLSIMGKAQSEKQLIAIAYTLEKLIKQGH